MAGRLILIFVVLFVLAPLSMAEEGDSNAELLERLQKLEKELSTLKAAASEAVHSPQEDTEKPSILSSINAKLYGYIKVDAAYETHATFPGNFSLWVQSAKDNRHDDQFILTANQTRVGLELGGPKLGDSVDIGGLIEADFYGSDTWGGSNTPQNKSGFRLRRAFVTATWPEHDFRILAGQEWDAFSPVSPSMLNFLAGGDIGNLGFRRPQIRLTKGLAFTSNSRLQIDAGIMRTIGTASDDSPAVDSGTDSGVPGTFARAGYTFPCFGELPATVGVSGHYAREEYDTNPTGSHNNIDSWSANFDMSVPITEKLKISGEAFRGKALGAYFGGIGQSLNITNGRGINSHGGWVAASIGPYGIARFNVGVTYEKVRRSDVDAADTERIRPKGMMVFGIVMCIKAKNLLRQRDVQHRQEPDRRFRTRGV